LAVVNEDDKEGFCSELVIILKKSPHAEAGNLD